MQTVTMNCLQLKSVSFLVVIVMVIILFSTMENQYKNSEHVGISNFVVKPRQQYEGEIQNDRHNIQIQHFPSSDIQGFSRIRDQCLEYYASASMSRQAHLDVLADEFADSPSRENLDGPDAGGRGRDDVTLVTQMTSERLPKLLKLVQVWSGPISVAVYVTSGTIETFKESLLQHFSDKPNMRIHLVAKEGRFFPVNLLRNIALNNSVTNHVFLSDVDFEPIPQACEILNRYVTLGYTRNTTLLVVPVFEQKLASIELPKYKSDLVVKWSQRHVVPFHFQYVNQVEIAKAGHKPTDYNKWRSSNTPYYINWNEYYEPYVVLEKSKTPKYCQEFVGRFFNKEVQIAELFGIGFKFLVVPDVWATHTHHLVNTGSDDELKCGRRVNAKFKIHLMEKYGIKFPVKLVDGSIDY